MRTRVVVVFVVVATTISIATGTTYFLRNRATNAQSGLLPGSQESFDEFRELLLKEGVNSKSYDACKLAFPIGGLESEYLSRLETSGGNHGYGLGGKDRLYVFEGKRKKDGEFLMHIICEGTPRRISKIYSVEISQ